VLSRFNLFPTAKHDPELHPFRPGLVFAFFNALAWQIGIGTPMVLFAEELGASPFQVGLAYSFVFVLTPVQIVATALLPRFGFKALMLGGWRTRSFFLGVPAVLALLVMQGGERPWMIDAMVWSVFFFCEAIRGRYFANDQFVSAVAGVGTLLVCAALFALLPVYPALLAQYVIALLGSTISYYSLKQLPDAERPRSISLRTVLRDTPRHLFAPSTFRSYVWLAAVCAVLATPIPPFAAYYLKVGPQLATGQIMLFEVLRYAGVMVAAWVLRRRIDGAGARPYFLLGLALHAVVGVYWWFYLENGFGGIIGIYVAYFLLGLGVATWSIANLNYLPKIVSAEERTLVVSVHGAVTACIGGLSPVVWGLFLKSDVGAGPGIDTAVFQWFFVSVVVGALGLIPLMARLPEEKGKSVDPILIGHAILRPFRAMTYLVNLVEPGTPQAKKKPENK
jgi:hypothetical protein